MNLNDTQEGLLNLVFKVADDRGWHILDLKDLRSMLKHVSDHAWNTARNTATFLPPVSARFNANC